MTVRTGAPHLFLDQAPPTAPRDTGYADGLAGKDPHAPQLYDRSERAAYFQGHIRGTLARIREAHLAATRHFTPAA